jgi:hypothetical protein
MKDFIKKLLIEGLDELQTKPKQLYGNGVEHKIFPSSDPNKLFKVGDAATVNKWYELFKRNPKYFPRVYRTGKLKDGNSYVEVEKLNTQKAISDWEALEEQLIMIGFIDKDSGFGLIDYLFREVMIDSEYENGISTVLKRVNPKLYQLFIKWVNFLSSVESLTSTVKDNSLDIHRYNFGYDSKGNIKCLDI